AFGLARVGRCDEARELWPDGVRSAVSRPPPRQAIMPPAVRRAGTPGHSDEPRSQHHCVLTQVTEQARHFDAGRLGAGGIGGSGGPARLHNVFSDKRAQGTAKVLLREATAVLPLGM